MAMKTLHAAVLICLLGLACSILAQTHMPPIDDAIVAQNNFESTFFGFRYQFPAEWHVLEDCTRIADNNDRYDKQLKDALAKNGPNTANNKTEVFPNYNLLVAGPSPVLMSYTPQMPRIVIWVHKRFNMLNNPGDHSKVLSMTMPNLTFLHPPEETTLSGQKFIRADYSFEKDSYLSQWVTQMGDYLIGFDLRARTADELKDLSQTMETVQFVSKDSAPASSRQDERELPVAGVSGNVQAAKLVEHVVPVYPSLARQARIQGSVRLHAILAKDGTVKSLEVLSGHPLLIQAAIDAVRKWRYAPTLVSGRRVEVDTTIDVIFALEEKPILRLN
jgi:TonB family protein